MPASVTPGFAVAYNRHMRRHLALTTLALAPLLAQTPAFEVASIRPSAPPESIAQQIQSGKLHLGVSIDQARVDIAFLSLADLIPIAYRVKPLALSGPTWLGDDHWDIVAKLPEGASKSKIPEMLQTLLRDRFKLEVHRETREQSVYVLTVRKEGPALKAADALPSADPDAAAILTTPEGKAVPTSDGRSMTISGGPAGNVRITYLDDPNQCRIELRTSMSTLADMFTLDKPVVDSTGLTGPYAVVLALPTNDAKPLMRSAMGMGIVGMSQDRTDATALAQSLQKAGLKLEARRVPIEMVVVDHVEKKPTEN
jgi:uncharacterized protein (TIGR03435 family)